MTSTEARPTDIPHEVDINFENKAHLIGFKFEPEVAKPASELTYAGVPGKAPSW